MLFYGASSSDRNKGLMAFWQEYNKGCGNSMTDSYGAQNEAVVEVDGQIW